MSPRIQRSGTRGDRAAAAAARRGAAARAATPAPRPQSRGIGPSRPNVVRPFALIVGVVYLAVGLIGFVATGFFADVVSSKGHSLAGFQLNTFHNVVHIAIGLIFIVVSQLRDAEITQGVVIGGGLIYVAAALLGFLDRLPILAIHGSLAADNFLHLASGLAAVLVGIAGAMQQSRSEPALA